MDVEAVGKWSRHCDCEVSDLVPSTGKRHMVCSEL